MKQDIQIIDLIKKEYDRQKSGLELIASDGSEVEYHVLRDRRSLFNVVDTDRTFRHDLSLLRVEPGAGQGPFH